MLKEFIDHSFRTWVPAFGRNSVSDENLGVRELGRITEPTLTLQERTKCFELFATVGKNKFFLKTSQR